MTQIIVDDYHLATGILQQITLLYVGKESAKVCLICHSLR